MSKHDLKRKQQKHGKTFHWRLKETSPNLRALQERRYECQTLSEGDES